jgi:predicted MFS family arabinose efflux permease
VTSTHIAPFQLAVALTVVSLVYISFVWEENYGTEPEKSNSLPQTSIAIAWQTIVSQPRVVLLGLACSLFEGAVFTFVFLWVPALQSLVGPDAMPTGVIFSCFMACVSSGGMLFDLLSTRFKYDPIEMGLSLFALASASMLLSATTSSFPVVLMSFLALEVCVGMFFPVAGSLRSVIFPDTAHATLMTLFRIPLNAIVVVGTMLADVWSWQHVCLLCACSFAGATALQWQLMQSQKSLKKRRD